MSLDVSDTVFEVAKSLGQVDLQQVTQQVLQVSCELRREPNLERNDRDGERS